MEQTGYVITFQAFMAAVIALAWFLIKRDFSKADDQAKQDKIDQKAAINGLGIRVDEANKKCDDHFADLEKRIREAELSLKEKISREELQAAVKELSEQMRKVQDDLTAFIRTPAERKRK